VIVLFVGLFFFFFFLIFVKGKFCSDDAESDLKYRIILSHCVSVGLRRNPLRKPYLEKPIGSITIDGASLKFYVYVVLNPRELKQWSNAFYV